MGGDEEIMELLWQNGQVVMHSHSQRSAGNKGPETPPITWPEATGDIREDETRPSDMFMKEDEMATWLHYPIDDISFENYIYDNDLINPPITAVPDSLPPPPPSVNTEIPSLPPVPLYGHVEIESRAFRSDTIISSNETAPVKASDSQDSSVSDKYGPNYVGNIGGGASASDVGGAGTSSLRWDMMVTCETETIEKPSSNSGDSGGATVKPSSQKPPSTNDQKRKGRYTDDNERLSEDVEFQNVDAQKQSHGTKRSRATEVHNLSERKRRDRINEKMKELQDLIPRCNKSDKASMLDEAIEYTKALQMQVKMMSMGYHMTPMMFPGVQQYMAPMGMDMVPYSATLPGSSLSNPIATTAHLDQWFSVPGFNMSRVTVAGSTASQTANMSGPMMNPLTLYSQTANMSGPMMNPLTICSQNQTVVPNFVYPFQEYVGLHQTQLPLPENQGGVQTTEAIPSSSRDATNPDRHQPG